MQNRSYYVGRVQALTFRFKKQNTGKLYLESLKKSSLKDYSAAISILYKAIRQEPGNARLYLELGNVFSRMKDWRYAIYNLEKARTINPVHHEILGELKYLYMETENIENLKKVVADIEAVFGKSPYFHYEIGFTYMKKEQMEEAEQVFLGIIRNYPDFPLSYFRLGQIALFRKEAPQKAKEYLDQFIKLVRQGKYSEILKRIPADLFMEKAREWLKMIHNKQNPPLTR
jgi:tetratricopeptide (TPR) repeat protein